jgi:catechol 2,3-dioxygenase-like lactoylglutathione lyase family enzyme
MSTRKSLIAQLGTVMQIAFVPKDFGAALRYWTETMGVGPFYKLSHVALENTKYRGQPSNIDFSMVLGYWGDIQIELIEQHNDAPSIYKSWRAEGREGLHHICILVEDMAHARAVCAASGAEVMQEAIVPGGGEVIYVDAGGGPGGLIEILKAPAASIAGFAFIKDQAKNWDGSDPVRSFG